MKSVAVCIHSLRVNHFNVLQGKSSLLQPLADNQVHHAEIVPVAANQQKVGD